VCGGGRFVGLAGEDRNAGRSVRQRRFAASLALGRATQRGDDVLIRIRNGILLELVDLTSLQFVPCIGQHRASVYMGAVLPQGVDLIRRRRIRLFFRHLHYLLLLSGVVALGLFIVNDRYHRR